MLLIVAALCLEVGIAWVHPPFDSWLNRWGSACSTGLIALGVFTEFLFSERGSKCQEELARRSNERAAIAVQEAAEANERAAAAQQETEKLRAIAAWRRLTESQFRALSDALTNSGEAASVRFVVLVNDVESLNFAQQISIPFTVAGWSVGYRFEAYLHGVLTGILLPESAENWLEEARVVAQRVRDALMAADIRFVNGWPLRPYMSTDSPHPLPAPIAWVYIGPKPAPSL